MLLHIRTKERAGMRRLIRGAVIFMGAGVSFAAVQIATIHLTSVLGIRAMCLLLCLPLGIVTVAAGILVLYKWSKFLFWLVVPVPALFLITTAILAPGMGPLFFAKCGLSFAKNYAGALLFGLWYWLSFYIVKPSRDDRLRQLETPSETELRRAYERRNPELNKAERERQLRLIASLPDEKRRELLRKQAEYEKSQDNI